MREEEGGPPLVQERQELLGRPRGPRTEEEAPADDRFLCVRVEDGEVVGERCARDGGTERGLERRHLDGPPFVWGKSLPGESR